MDLGPKSYAIEGRTLDHTTFEEAEKVDRECEAYWFRIGQQIGGWTPTRELARGAYRTIDNISYKLERRVRWLEVATVLEGIGIIAMAIGTFL